MLTFHANGTIDGINNSNFLNSIPTLQRRIMTGPTAFSGSSFTHTVTTGVEQIEIWIQDASAGDSDMRIQLTDTSLHTSGYGYSAGFSRSNGTGGGQSITDGFKTYGFDSDSYNISGCWTLRNPHGHTWIGQHQFWGSIAADHDFFGVGRKTLNSALTSFLGKFSAPYFAAVAFLLSPFSRAKALPAFFIKLLASLLILLLSSKSFMFWFASESGIGLFIVEDVVAIFDGLVIALSTLVGNSSSSDKSSYR